MSSFANRVVLITGAAQGIGRELARQLAAEGAAIAAVDLQSEVLATLAGEFDGKKFASAVADVTDRPALTAAVAKLQDRLGPTDLLIANAGIGKPTSALSFSAADIEDQVRVNLIGVANSVEAVLPKMLERKQGQLAVLSSLASARGMPRMAGYCASKAGVNALFESLRVELQGHGIAVTTICPAWIRTQMTAHLADRLPGLMELPIAARLILEAIRRKRPYYAFPTSAVWRMRILRWLPLGVADRWIDRQFQKLVQGSERA
jgi:NAD(P)-dependent dehydrogenase (short-subunit alcohol dehydrogenase family)